MRPTLPLILLLLAPGCRTTEPQNAEPTPVESGADPSRLEGFLHVEADAETGSVRLGVPDDGAELLWQVSLVSGLGSNDVGLDRGQLGPGHVVVFRRVGERVLMVAPNQDWRSSSENEVERRAAREAFAQSVLAAFDLDEARDGRLWFDATDFLLADAHGIADSLARAGQGRFRLDRDRSLLLPEALASFPHNTEIESLLTFAGDDPGREVRTTTPDPGSVSLRVRNSFVALPDLDTHDYRPRRYEPRAGYFATAT